MLSDNGGSTINWRWEVAWGALRVGWLGQSECVYVCVERGGVWLTKELEEVEDSACVKAALNYISNHQSARQQNRTRGLDISPTCTELAQHLTSKVLQLTLYANTHTFIHTLLSQDAPSERE